MEQVGKKPVFSREDLKVKTHQLSTVQHLQTKTNGQPDQQITPHRSWWHSPLVGYGSNLLFVAAAFLINWLETLVDIHDYFIGMLFVIGTFLVAWIWGKGPGFLALIIGIFCTDYLAIPPIHTFTFYLWPGLASLLPFVVLQLLILWLIAKQKTYESQLLCAQQEVSHHAHQVAVVNQRLTESNQNLAQSNRQLEQANQVKDQFLSMASHELRTPVTSIHGYVQLLLRKLKKQSEQNPGLLPVRDSLGKVDEQIRRLIDLVNDLLNINSLRSGKMPFRLLPCDLCSLYREVVEEQQAEAGRPIDLFLPPEPVFVQADKDRLSQVVTNLVSNALKYSYANTVICVDVSQKAGEAILAVHNEGPVLSQEQQENIFEPFYRSPDAQSSATPGWGLGLAISKEIITQHDGRLWVESSKEKGTTFFVALPLSTSAESG